MQLANDLYFPRRLQFLFCIDDPIIGHNWKRHLKYSSISADREQSKTGTK